MGTIRTKKKAETRISAGLRPDQTVKVRARQQGYFPLRLAPSSHRMDGLPARDQPRDAERQDNCI